MHTLTRPYIHTLKMLFSGIQQRQIQHCCVAFVFFVHWMGFVNNLLLLRLHIQYISLKQISF